MHTTCKECLGAGSVDCGTTHYDHNVGHEIQDTGSCLLCGGKGWYNACHICHGTRYEGRCRSCEPEAALAHWQRETGAVTCPDCQGRGFTETPELQGYDESLNMMVPVAVACERCNGTRYITISGE